eukprot:1122102-Pelagomonas_calceolata.AAC.3
MYSCVTLFQRGSAKHVPEYAHFAFQVRPPIATSSDWDNFSRRPVCLDRLAKAHMGHTNPNSVLLWEDG